VTLQAIPTGRLPDLRLVDLDDHLSRKLQKFVVTSIIQAFLVQSSAADPLAQLGQSSPAVVGVLPGTLVRVGHDQPTALLVPYLNALAVLQACAALQYLFLHGPGFVAYSGGNNKRVLLLVERLE